MPEISYGGAALAGLLSFLSPCILPMVPFYLSYLAGISMAELRGDATIRTGARWRLVSQATGFALGVTSIFVLLGMGATALGQIFVQWRPVLTYVSAGVLILFGCHFLGLLRIPFLYREARFDVASAPVGLAGAYLVGLAFGFGWVPCVGPALAAILMIAGGMGDIWRGGLLLLICGLAMTAPFVLAAVFADPFLRLMARHRHRLGRVEQAMGVMLILFGILIATDAVVLVSDWLVLWMPWLLNLG